jgi:uncharacterized RDD family membrane protein YckC
MNANSSMSLQGQYAGLVTRLVAFTIDIVIVNVTVLAATGLTALLFGFFSSAFNPFPAGSEEAFVRIGTLVTGAVSVATMLVMLWLYPSLFWMITGQTIGKRIMGLRVVRMDGSRLTFWQGILRVLGYWLSALPLFLGFAWALFSDQRRAWHDYLANTCVIYSWEAKDSEVLRERLARTGRQLIGSTDEP